MLYQITYELKAQGKDYSPLYLAIKKLGKSAHPLESVWYVDSANTISEITQALAPYLDPKSDKILISEIGIRSFGGRASTNFWEWIKEYVKK